MTFTRRGSVQIVAGAILGVSTIVVACGGDDATESTPGPDASTTGSSSGTTSSSGATSSSGGSSGAASSGDAGVDAAKSGDGGTGTKKNGEACKDDNECKSGMCFKGEYCTISCTLKDDIDPVCQALGGNFSGKCAKQSVCLLK